MQGGAHHRFAFRRRSSQDYKERSRVRVPAENLWLFMVDLHFNNTEFRGELSERLRTGNFVRIIIRYGRRASANRYLKKLFRATSASKEFRIRDEADRIFFGYLLNEVVSGLNM